MTPIPPRPPRTLPDIVHGNGAAALGDSITAADEQVDVGLIGSRSWFVRACMASGQRIRYVRNAGVSGDKTDQMLARIQTDVIAYRPDRCFVLAGANDLTNNYPLATTRANLTAIYATLRAQRIEPIPCTLTPLAGSSLSHRGDLEKLNAWIRWYGATHGLWVCDLSVATADPATGLWKAGYSDDNIHPTSLATAAMAAQVIADVGALFPQSGVYLDRYAQLAAASANLLQRAWFEVDADVDGVGDGWTKAGGNWGSGVTPSRVQTAGVFGYEQVVSCATSALRYLSGFAVAGSWAVGDRLAFSGRFTTSAGADVVGTATAGASSALTNAGAGWTPSQFVNWIVTITSGTGAGQSRAISDNTATVLTLSAPWATIPDATSQYRVSGCPVVTAQLVFNGAPGTPELVPVFKFCEAVTGYVWRLEGIVPAGTTSVECQLSVGSGLGAVKWSQPTIVNMTALGMS